MEIKIQLLNRVFLVSFGYKTNWFEQKYFLTITEEWYDEWKQVTYAEMLFHS